MQGTLVDWQIKSLDLVSPLQDHLVQPASVDLTLGKNCATMDPSQNPIHIGSTSPIYIYHKNWSKWTLYPGQLVLFETAEVITLPPDILGKFDGKSSLGRIGLMAHVSAGFIDPGYTGVLTLEIYNCGALTLVLIPGIRIGQVNFVALNAFPDRAYGHPDLGSHYQGAKSVQGGKFDDAG